MLIVTSMPAQQSILSRRAATPGDATQRKLHLQALVCSLSIATMLVALATPADAQITLGEPVVGNGTASKSSTAFLDAGFFTGTDMCARIANACSSTSPIPNGTTIDARAFTGAQVCTQTNVTTMLKDCAKATSNGGKLLLGTVSIYADGPTGGVIGNYSDGNTPASGIGTPAFLIPSKFWGIEGVSRGESAAGTPTNPTAGLGTFLSICTSSKHPVGNDGVDSGEIPPGPLPGGLTSPVCTTAFPKRMFTISSTSVPTGSTTMTITVSTSTLNSGVNIYPGELTMVKNNNAGDNGTYKIQSIGPLAV
jgi:hypothetical protein